MLEVAKEKANSMQLTISHICMVPGAYDMPILVDRLLQNQKIDGVATLGAIIQGQTKHDEVISHAAARTLTDLSLKYQKPVSLGISGPGMQERHAYARIRPVAERAIEALVKISKELEKIQQWSNSKNCLVFLNKSDEFFVVSNGLTLDDHIEIQKSLKKLFEVTLTISIGYGDTPFEANLKAYNGKQNNVILNEEHTIFGFIDNKLDLNVSIMHLDVDDLKSKRNDNSPYEISLKIFELYSKIGRYFIKKKSLTFFMGGDNYMVVASNDAKNSIQNFIDMIKNDDHITLNCGIGNAQTSRDAVKLATKSLDTIRDIRDSGKQKPDVYEL